MTEKHSTTCPWCKKESLKVYKSGLTTFFVRCYECPGWATGPEARSEAEAWVAFWKPFKPQLRQEIHILKPITLKAVLGTGNVPDGEAYNVAEWFFDTLGEDMFLDAALPSAIKALQKDWPCAFAWLVENSFVGVRDVAPIVIKGDVITWETISGRQRFLAGEGLTGISGILKNSNLATNNLRTVKRYVTIEETGGE